MVASIVLVAYVGMQAVAKSEAERFGEAYARANGNPAARVAAEPRPVSPFNWTVFVANGNEVSYAHVNVRRTQPRSVAADAGFLARLDAAYRPLDVAQWQRRTRFGATPEEQALARSAWNASALSFFRWFAELPVLDGISAAGHCVWFRDLRFDTPGRTSLPFRYGVCRDGPDDRWQLHASASDGSAAEARR